MDTATQPNKTREAVLLTLFPAILIVAGYMLFFSKSKQLASAESELENVRSTAVAPHVANLERMKTAATQAELARLKDDQTRLKTRQQELLLVRETPPASRNNALRQLKEMLWARGLHQFDESSPESGSLQTAQSLDAALKRIAPAQAAVSTPKLFEIRFFGRYGDVLAALETLEASQSQIIPVSLSMSEAQPETAWRSWTLVFRL